MLEYLEDYRADRVEPHVFENKTFYAITEYLHPDVDLKEFDPKIHGYDAFECKLEERDPIPKELLEIEGVVETDDEMMNGTAANFHYDTAPKETK